LRTQCLYGGGFERQVFGIDWQDRVCHIGLSLLEMWWFSSLWHGIFQGYNVMHTDHLIL
jgi:hypothetical protein